MAIIIALYKEMYKHMQDAKAINDNEFLHPHIFKPGT
jgi:hypothetical protein